MFWFWSEYSWVDSCVLFLALMAIFVTYLKRRFSYWKKRNLPYLEPIIPFGSLNRATFFTETAGLFLKHIYDQMKRENWRHGGIYLLTEPLYMVVDLEYVKNVLTKDFRHFVNRGVHYNEKDKLLTDSVLTAGGTKWHNLRTKLTPTFTTKKMKMMFQTLVDCEDNLHKKIEHLYQNGQLIDIKELLECYTIDVIGSCAFGLDCNSFADDDSSFRKYTKKAFNPTILQYFKVVLPVVLPGVAKVLGIKVFPEDVSDFFIKVVKDNVEYREKNNYTRKDFMQMLIDLKNNKLPEDEKFKDVDTNLTMDGITAQSFVFFLAAFETASTTMAFALYELAKNQEIQNRIRNEINTVLTRHEKKITYDAIQEMKYMDQVLDETLRKYPAIPFTTRECVKDYKVPGEDVIIEKGVRIIIPILGIHHDEEFYPDPEKFDPDRFNEENLRSRPQYAHIPFGEGPRNCIGLRFGLMQSKVGLASLLRKYNFTVNKKTKEPLKFVVKSIILLAQGNIWLDAEKI